MNLDNNKKLVLLGLSIMAVIGVFLYYESKSSVEDTAERVTSSYLDGYNPKRKLDDCGCKDKQKQEQTQAETTETKAEA